MNVLKVCREGNFGRKGTLEDIAYVGEMGLQERFHPIQYIQNKVRVSDCRKDYGKS